MHKDIPFITLKILENIKLPYQNYYKKLSKKHKN